MAAASEDSGDSCDWLTGVRHGVTSLNFQSSSDSNYIARGLLLPRGITGAVAGGNLFVDAIIDSTDTSLSSCYDAVCGGTRQLDVKSFRKALVIR